MAWYLNCRVAFVWSRAPAAGWPRHRSRPRRGGATVHITGRTLRDGEHPERLDRGGSLAAVLEASAVYPGKVIAHRVDHTSDIETEAVVRKVIGQEGRLDVLVNSAWGGNERMSRAIASPSTTRSGPSRCGAGM